MTNLLILENNLNLRNTLKKIFQNRVSGMHITESQSFTDAFNRVIEEQPDLILTNIHIDGQSASLFVDKIIKNYPSIQIIILSEYSPFDYQSFVKKIKKGVVVFTGELNMDQIIRKINILIQLRSLKKSKGRKNNNVEESEVKKSWLLPIRTIKENKVSFIPHSLTHSLTHSLITTNTIYQ